MTKKEFLQGLRAKNLVFGWYNGEFVTVDMLEELEREEIK